MGLSLLSETLLLLLYHLLLLLLHYHLLLRALCRLLRLRQLPLQMRDLRGRHPTTRLQLLLHVMDLVV